MDPKQTVPLTFITDEEVSKVIGHRGYDLDKRIGQGAYANVYLAKSRKYEQNFVIKVSKCDHEVTANDAAEIRTLMHLGHPNVIRLFDYFMNGKNLFVVLEYCENGSLGDMIREKGPIKPPVLYKYCRDIVEALMHCHKMNVAHRDLKPDNILIDRYGRIKLADFGISAICDPDKQIKSFTGSRVYMSPEQLLSGACSPFKSDIFSLGVLFYVMACGKIPWTLDSYNSMITQVCQGIVDFNDVEIDSDFAFMISQMTRLEPERISLSDVLQYPCMQPNAPAPGSNEKARKSMKRQSPIVAAPQGQPPKPIGEKAKSLPKHLIATAGNRRSMMERKQPDTLQKTFYV